MTLKKGILLVTGLAIGISINAQNDTKLVNKKTGNTSFTEKPTQVIYVGVEASAPGISLSYDRRFAKRPDGLGFRVGVGYSFNNNFKATIIPVGVNYLVGNNKRGHYFEAGIAGALIVVGKSGDNATLYNFVKDVYLPYNSTLVSGGANLGYRYQPTQKRMVFRAGVAPMFLKSYFNVNGYITLGYRL